MPHRELSLTPTPPAVHQHLSPSVCQTGRSPFPPPSVIFFTSLWVLGGVGRGRPRAGHPVRGLLTVPELSAGAYWREIHINTLSVVPPSARHNQVACLAQTALHGPPVLKEREEMGFQGKCATVCKPPVSCPVATELTKGDNAKFEKPNFHFLLLPRRSLGSYLACGVYTMTIR